MLPALALTAALIGCSGEPNSASTSNPPEGRARGDAGVAEVAERSKHGRRRARQAAQPCPVTSPGSKVPATSGDFNYGNGSLAVLLWPKGRLVAGRLPDGSSYAETRPDGSIVAKLGWWRAVEGQLTIEGERLDASAPPLRADVPDGYGPTGFQPTGLSFPTEGCWKVLGRVGGARLTFVVLVRKR
jgi:hypothetical protein